MSITYYLTTTYSKTGSVAGEEGGDMLQLDHQPDERKAEKIDLTQTLSAVDNLQTVKKLGFLLIGIFGLFIFAELFFSSGSATFLCLGFVLASWIQLAIIEELHDGYHYRLLSSRYANELLTGLYARSVGISMTTARAAHHRHHRYFGTADDPDYRVYAQCPRGWNGWLTFAAVYFSGYGALKSLVKQQGISVAAETSRRQLVEALVFHAVLFGISAVWLHPAAYVLFWAAPLLTLTFGVGRFRTMVDHWTPEPWTDPRIGTEFRGALYNFDGVFQRHLAGAPFGYQYHGLHHLIPSIPNYNLEKAVEADYLCPPELVRTTTYYARLREMLLNGSGK